MRFFFRSRQFKILLSVVLILLAVSLSCAWIGGVLAPQADILGTVTAPFRSLAARASSAVSDFISAYTEGNELLLKNAELEGELNDMRKKLAEYENTVSQNEFYKNYLEIKDNNPSFQFASAMLISRDKEDPFGGFVINKGSLGGISKNDPVITDAGLVGYITEVGLSTAKVTTILSTELTVGAIDNRTGDSGILSGSLETAGDKKTKLYNLSRSCNVAIGDYVVTSGEGIFPAGLLIGVVDSIGSDNYNTSIYASVKPFAALDEIRSVMVITDFEGQGGLINREGE